MQKCGTRMAASSTQFAKSKAILNEMQKKIKKARRRCLIKVAKEGVEANKSELQALKTLESEYRALLKETSDHSTNKATVHNSVLEKGKNKSMPFSMDEIINPKTVIKMQQSSKPADLSSWNSTDGSGEKANPPALPPLPSEITESMSRLSSTSNLHPSASLFDFLSPLSQHQGASQSIEVTRNYQNINDLLGYVNSSYTKPQGKKPKSGNLGAFSSLPFAENTPDCDDSLYTIEDETDKEMEAVKAAFDKVSSSMSFDFSKKTEVPECVRETVSYDELKEESKREIESLLGDISLSDVPNPLEPLKSLEPEGMDHSVLNEIVSTVNVEKKKRRSKHKKTLLINEEMTVLSVSKLLKMPIAECLEKIGELVENAKDRSSLVTSDVVELLAMDKDIEVKVNNKFNLVPTNMNEAPLDLPPRPPVIAVMGHVDHGKTTLLDYLRHSSVASKEAGGITQAITSFTVPIGDVNSKEYGGNLVFIDTPGHAAFTTMRKRGASATDIILLIIAANDGIKEQTKEIIDIIKANSIPFVVAVTKCGMNNVNKAEAMRKISTALLDYDIVTTDYGGEVNLVGVDSITGEGMEKLKKTLYEEGVLREIRCKPDARGEGVVLESEKKPGAGTVIHTIVRWGSFHVGSTCVLGESHGKIKQILCNGKSVRTGRAGDSVDIIGLENGGDSGEWLFEVENEAMAEGVINYRKRKLLHQKEMREHKQKKEGETVKEKIEIPLVLKADVDGSLHAIRNEIDLLNAQYQKVFFNLVSSSMGNVNLSDVDMVHQSHGILMCFNSTMDSRTTKMLRINKDTRVESNIIYSLLDNLKIAAKEYMPVVNQPVVVGSCEVHETFASSDQETVIAGCKVVMGNMNIKGMYRIVRNGEIIKKGTGFSSIRHFKDEVSTINEGEDCGIKIDKYKDFQAGDRIEVYEMKDVKQELE